MTGGHHHPHAGHSHNDVRPGLRATIDNWRNSDLPFLRRLRLAARNEWTKLRTRQSCCGHPGEPGC